MVWVCPRISILQNSCIRVWLNQSLSRSFSYDFFRSKSRFQSFFSFLLGIFSNDIRYSIVEQIMVLVPLIFSYGSRMLHSFLVFFRSVAIVLLHSGGIYFFAHRMLSMIVHGDSCPARSTRTRFDCRWQSFSEHDSQHSIVSFSGCSRSNRAQPSIVLNGITSIIRICSLVGTKQVYSLCLFLQPFFVFLFDLSRASPARKLSIVFSLALATFSPFRHSP